MKCQSSELVSAIMNHDPMANWQCNCANINHIQILNAHLTGYTTVCHFNMTSPTSDSLFVQPSTIISEPSDEILRLFFDTERRHKPKGPQKASRTSRGIL